MSERPVLCPGDNLILEFRAQIAEVIAIPRDAHDQVSMLLRILLSCAQCGSIDHVELDVMAIQPEVGPYEVPAFRGLHRCRAVGV